MLRLGSIPVERAAGILSFRGKMRNYFLSAAVLLFTLFAGGAYAEELEVPIHFSKPEQTDWCWAGAIESITRGSISQCVAASRALQKNDQYCCEEVNVKYCIRGFNTGAALNACGITTRTIHRSLTMAEVRGELRNNRPVVISVDLGKDNHAMVIYGVTDGGKMKVWNPQRDGVAMELSHEQLESRFGEWESTYLIRETLPGVAASDPKIDELRRATAELSNANRSQSLGTISQLREATQSLNNSTRGSGRKTPDVDLSDVQRRLEALQRGR